MLFAILLVLIVSLCSPALGALPPPPGPYFIRNIQNGAYLTNENWVSTPGNPIIVAALHGPGVNRTNQEWTVSSVATVGSSGVYEFRAIGPAVPIAVFGQAGAQLTVQPLPTPLNVTEVPTASGQYWLTYPFINPPLAVTSTNTVPNWLTLQPLVSTSLGQRWNFTLV